MDALVEFFKVLIALGALATPVVVGLVEGVKQVFPKMPPRYKPVIAVAVGEIVTVLLALQTGYSWQIGASAGLLSGLAAAGLYAWGQSREQAAARG